MCKGYLYLYCVCKNITLKSCIYDVLCFVGYVMFVVQCNPSDIKMLQIIINIIVLDQCWVMHALVVTDVQLKLGFLRGEKKKSF